MEREKNKFRKELIKEKNIYTAWYLESITLYGAKVWSINKFKRNKLISTKMGSWKKKKQKHRMEIGIKKTKTEEIETTAGMV